LKSKEVVFMEELEGTTLQREINTLRFRRSEIAAALKPVACQMKELRHAANAGVPGKAAELADLQASQKTWLEAAAALDHTLAEKSERLAELTRRAAQLDRVAREFDLSPGQAAQLKGETSKQLRDHAKQLSATPAGGTRDYAFQTGDDVAW
jgi:ABC-type transporter Mla subunit MlaD